MLDRPKNSWLILNIDCTQQHIQKINWSTIWKVLIATRKWFIRCGLTTQIIGSPYVPSVQANQFIRGLGHSIECKPTDEYCSSMITPQWIVWNKNSRDCTKCIPFDLHANATVLHSTPTLVEPSKRWWPDCTKCARSGERLIIRRCSHYAPKWKTHEKEMTASYNTTQSNTGGFNGPSYCFVIFKHGSFLEMETPWQAF